MSAEPPALPRALDDDDDDVAWALQTAGVQWERGGAADAIVWLKRAAEAAVEAGAFGRSADIQRRANEIDRWLQQRVSFPIPADDDDGVDSLLATETGEVEVEVETGSISEPSPSLVDALEAEAADYTAAPTVQEAPVEDLGDLEDVEDIEAVDLEEVDDDRTLQGYREELLDETTHARSEVSRALLTNVEAEARAPSSLPPASARPGSERSPGSTRRPGSERVLTQPPSSRSSRRETTRVSAPPPKPYASSSRPATARPASALPSRVPTSPGVSTAPRAASTSPREVRRSLNATPQVPPPPEYKLPPPPIPRLPLPEPRPSARPLPEVSDARSPFPSEPVTLPASERPSHSHVVEIPTAPDVPRVTEAPRQRVESLPEVSATELDAPDAVQEAPTSKYTLGNPDEGTTASFGARVRAVTSSVPARGPAHEAPVSTAAPAELDAAVNALSETPPPPPVLDVGLLAACRGLEDLPPETQAELAARARIEVLAPDQEVSGFGLALVTRGHVVVMPTIAEGACGYAGRGEPVFSQGTLSEGVPLRAVALAEGADVAVWRPEDFEHVLETCPWVADELRAVGDRFQALAGAAMGPLGDRLDDNMRAMLTDRCELRVLFGGDILIEQGKAPDGLYVVGAGKLEIVAGGKVRQELGPGDLPFASSVLTHEKASGTVRAASTGALVLHADRMATHELIVSVPPLLELLSMV
jgi:hypothetical protein